MTKRVFITYSHNDPDLFQQFMGVLSPLDKRNVIKVVTDKDIRAGEDWNERIKRELARCDFAVAFVTPSFLDSDYVQKHEMPFLLQRHEGREIRILPFFIKASPERARTFRIEATNGEPRIIDLNSIQGLNGPDRTVAALRDAEERNQAFVDAADELVRIVEEAESASNAEPPPADEPERQASTIPVDSDPGIPHSPPEPPIPIWARRFKHIVVCVIVALTAGTMYYCRGLHDAVETRVRTACTVLVISFSEGGSAEESTSAPLSNLRQLCAIPFQFGAEMEIESPGALDAYFGELFSIARGKAPRPSGSGTSPTYLRAIDLIQGCGRILADGYVLRDMIDVQVEVDPTDRNKSKQARYNAPGGAEYDALATLKVRGVPGHKQALLYLRDAEDGAKIVGLKLE